jgi:DNA-binding NtrC family response regulator
MNSLVLFVSPRKEDADRLSQLLSPLPVVFDHVPDLQQARTKLRQGRYKVILTEAALPDGSWPDVLSLTRDVASRVEVIVTDAHADTRLWEEALQLGAFDLLVQPFDRMEVRRILSGACSLKLLERAACTAL